MVGPTIDATGFHKVGFNGYLADWEATFRAIYGSDIDLSAGSPDAQFIGTLAQRDTNAEQLLEQIYLGRSPAGAVGAGLSRILRLNGLLRKGAEFSTVPILISGVPGTVVPVDSLIADPDDPLLPSFKTAAPYTIGVGGTIAGQATCTEAGPVNVGPDRLKKIQTITGGWESVTNTSAAAPGRLVEQDPQARARRDQSVAMPSQSLTDGLQAALANLSGVDDVQVYENATGAVNLKGDPAHSIHVIIDGGIAAAIANAIWVKGSQGATRVGSVRFTVIDHQGNPQDMGWDIPVDLNVYITVALNRTPTTFETNAIKNALVAFGQQTSRIGRNVAWWELGKPINDLNITGDPGQPSVTSVKLGSAPTPTLQQDLSVAFNERPRYDVARVLVIGP